MLFKSREKPTLARRARLLLWPRRSFSRSAQYVWKRLFRLKASPHKIAVGFAAGVFASITPLIGVQMVMAAAIALILRGSLAAAMLATFVGNPLSWPLIWGATYGLGSLMLGSPGAAEAASLSHGADRVSSVIYTMLIGSIPIGLVSAAVSYGLTARAIEAVRGSSMGAAGRSLRGWPMIAIPTWPGRALRELARREVSRREPTSREPTWRLW
jgi:uncharacterized protein (DUF2062 family)